MGTAGTLPRPDRRERALDRLAQYAARSAGLRPVMRQHVVEQDDLGRDVVYFAALRIVRTRCGGHQQAENEPRHGADDAETSLERRRESSLI